MIKATRTVKAKSEANKMSGTDSTCSTYLSDFRNLPTRIKYRVAQGQIECSPEQLKILDQVEAIVSKF